VHVRSQKLQPCDSHFIAHLSGSDYSNYVNANAYISRLGDYHPAGTARSGSELNGAHRYQALPSRGLGPFNEPSTPITLP
jgi:hypothetical protein